jgi:hypothetical protein
LTSASFPTKPIKLTEFSYICDSPMMFCQLPPDLLLAKPVD